MFCPIICLSVSCEKHLGLGTRPCSTASAISIMNNSVERLSIMEQAPKFCLSVSRIPLLEHRVIAFKTILGSSSNLLTMCTKVVEFSNGHHHCQNKYTYFFNNVYLMIYFLSNFFKMLKLVCTKPRAIKFATFPLVW